MSRHKNVMFKCTFVMTKRKNCCDMEICCNIDNDHFKSNDVGTKKNIVAT